MMNNCSFIGRLTTDPKQSYIPANQTAVCEFNLAIDKGKKDGKDLGADFPKLKAYGKLAEIIERYVHKGDLFGAVCRVRTDKYDKDGQTHYVTEFIVQDITFCEKKKAAGYQQVAEPEPF